MQQIQVPFDIFNRRVKQDYSNWKTALPREFVQNGVDAGAKRIDFIFEGDYLHVKNDGQPMSMETCKNALLTLGGSEKEEGSVGGFGVAKEILYFAWKEWFIRSADYMVTGKGCLYQIEDGLPFHHGVHSMIYKDPDLHPYYIMDHLQTCQTATGLYLNNELQSPNQRGRKIRDLGWATLHKKPGKSDYFSVRVKGVTMFQPWNPTDHDLVLELHGNTRDLLTANRDGLKEPYNEELQKILREIQVNKKSALKVKDQTAISLFHGYGNIRSQRKLPQATEAAQHASPSFMAQPLAASVPTIEPEASPKNPNRPDILVYVDENNKIPLKYQPGNWSKKILSFVSMWKLVLKQVLEDNNEERTFGIGIVIEKDVNAKYRSHKDTDYFLLNPTTVDFSLQAKDRLTLIEELKIRAIHEIAHLLSGSDHDEDFVIKLEEIARNTWKSNKTYKKIAKIRKIDLNTEIS